MTRFEDGSSVRRRTPTGAFLLVKLQEFFDFSPNESGSAQPLGKTSGRKSAEGENGVDIVNATADLTPFCTRVSQTATLNKPCSSMDLMKPIF